MTRFNEQNCHAQCSTCNNPENGEGEQAKHGFAIDRMYGPGTAQQLIDLSEVRGQKELTKIALKDLAKEYRLKAKAMAKKRGIVL